MEVHVTTPEPNRILLIPPPHRRHQMPSPHIDGATLMLPPREPIRLAERAGGLGPTPPRPISVGQLNGAAGIGQASDRAQPILQREVTRVMSVDRAERMAYLRHFGSATLVIQLSNKTYAAPAASGIR